MKVSEKICKATVISVASIMSVFGALCILDEIDSVFRLQGVQVLAAGLSMPDSSDKKSDTDLNDKAKENIKQNSSSSKPAKNLDTDYAEKNHKIDTIDTAIDETEQTFLVTESLYRESNMSYENFFVKNATDLSIDLGGYLHADLPFEYVICPHRTALYERSAFEAFVTGLTDETISAARPVSSIVIRA